MSAAFCCAMLMTLIVSIPIQASTLTNLVVRSEKMGRDIPVSLVLPVGYDAAAETRYPSVYVLHGANGSCTGKASEAVWGQLVDKYAFIAVVPDGGKTSWWLDSPIDPKYQYETFLVGEVVPYVDANYKTVADRAKRAITGGSMGGHGACYIGMRHKDIFGVIGNIYGGVDLEPWSGRWEIDKRLGPRDENIALWEEHSVVNVAKSLKNGEVELVSVVGTEDFFLGCNRQLHELLSANGVAHTYVEMRSQTTLGSTHGKFYAQGAEVCLRFIYNYFKDGYGHLGDATTKISKDLASVSCEFDFFDLNEAAVRTFRERLSAKIGGPFLIAHRGCQSLAPENTVASFVCAARLGLDAIETDVQISADGVLVCVHDASLKRMFGIDRKVSEMTLADLRTLVPVKGNGRNSWPKEMLRIPTFAEYLDVCQEYDKVPFIETKGDVAVVKPVLDEVRRRGLSKIAVLSSVSFDHIREARRLDKEIFVHHIFSKLELLDELAAIGNAGLSYNFTSPDDAPAGIVGRVHAKGVKMCLRAGDTPESVAMMRAMGLDYIPTNVTIPVE